MRVSGVQLWVLLAGQAMRYGVAFGAVSLVTALVYYFGPNRKQTLRMVFPGAALFVLVLCVNLLGDWLRDRVDPTSRSR